MDIKSHFQRVWLASNPVIRKGEVVHDKTTGRLKIGDGRTRWSELSYVAGGGSSELPAYLSEDALRAAFGLSVAATVTASGALVAAKHNPVDASGGAKTMTLPTGQAEGTSIGVEKFDSSANAVTVSGSIRGVGSSTVTLPWKNEALVLRADSTGSWWPVSGHKTKASLDAFYTATSRLPSAFRLPGPKVANGGDSITVGTGASNASVTSYVAVLPKILGARMSHTPINGGVAGERSDQLLARMDRIIASGAQFLTILIGTNDAGQLVPIGTFQANIAAIKAKADAAGLPIVFGTVPPRSSATASNIRDLIGAYNLWLRMWAAQNGIPLADVFGALVDPTTGYLAAANDSGDGTHPSNAGHAAIATVFAAVLKPLLPLLSWPVVSAGGVGLVSDPLMVATTGWSNAAAQGVTSRTLVPAANGDLPAGQWYRFTLDNSAGGSLLSSMQRTILGAGITPVTGNVYLLAMYIRGSSATAISKVAWLDGSTQVSIPFQQFPTNAPGPLVAAFTVPSRTWTSTLRLGIEIKAAAGEIATVDIGATNVFDLTALGVGSLATIY